MKCAPAGRTERAVLPYYLHYDGAGTGASLNGILDAWMLLVGLT